MKIAAVFSVIITMIVGCDALRLDDSRRRAVEAQKDAGNVFISTTLIAPWQDYVDSLTTNFKLTAEDALARVLPVTSAAEDIIVDSLAAELRLALAGGVTTSESQRVLNPDGTTSRTSTSTETEAAPDISSTNIPAEADAKTAGTLKPKSTLELGVDPFQQFTAAKALLDEVKILGSFVKDAARRNDMIPYIARIQISVIPDARYQPYDTHLNLSFFSRLKCGPEKNRRPEICGKRRGAVVVPLLATDNAERQSSFRSQNVIRQLALALSAAQGSAAFGGGVNRRLERLSSALTNDVNSLLTLGSPTPGSLYVRLGAQLVGNNQYATVPRNHNVTVLVMVPVEVVEPTWDPKDQTSARLSDRVTARLNIAGSVTLRDATSGEALKRDATGDRARQIMKYVNEDLKKETGGGKISIDQAYDMMFAIFGQNYAKFRGILKEVGFTKNDGFVADIWNEFIEEFGRSGFLGDQVDLPARPPVALPPEQHFIVEDDGKTNTIIRLRGGKSLKGLPLEATLFALDPENKQVRLESKQVQVGASGRSVDLAFPSLAKLGLKQKAGGSSSNLQIELRVVDFEVYRGDLLRVKQGGTGCHAAAGVQTVKKFRLAMCYRNGLNTAKTDSKPKQPAPKMSLTAMTSMLVPTEGGGGQVMVSAKFTEKTRTLPKAKISVEGATLMSAMSADRKTVPINPDGTVTIAQDMAVTMILSNLAQNRTVTMMAKEDKPKGASVASPLKLGVGAQPGL